MKDTYTKLCEGMTQLTGDIYNELCKGTTSETCMLNWVTIWHKWQETSTATFC